jgi:tetratricopeptide (TPR) repeat protein
MRIDRLAAWTIALGWAVVSTVALAQESSQKLFESGNFAAVAERGNSGSPEDRYLAALAHLKAGNADAATGEMNRLRDEGPDDAWKQLGASGVAMLQHNDGEAVEAGRRATQAFERATELKPDLAYAHYYAGQAFHKQRNMSKAAEHYQQFLQLAPESPDRAAIQSILRTLRG